MNRKKIFIFVILMYSFLKQFFYYKPNFLYKSIFLCMVLLKSQNNKNTTKQIKNDLNSKN